MASWRVTYDNGETEYVEADVCSEGPHFLIFSKLVGNELDPFLRIRASSVVRAERS